MKQLDLRRMPPIWEELLRNIQPSLREASTARGVGFPRDSGTM
jgi:hypothetical protein